MNVCMSLFLNALIKASQLINDCQLIGARQRNNDCQLTKSRQRKPLSLRSTLKKAVALCAIFSISLSISTAQQLQIRRETSFGSLEDDFGEHSVFINSKSQIVVFGMSDCDTCSFDDFRMDIFDLQFKKILLPRPRFGLRQ
jgi:hypothetical protein